MFYFSKKLSFSTGVEIQPMISRDDSDQSRWRKSRLSLSVAPREMLRRMSLRRAERRNSAPASVTNNNNSNNVFNLKKCTIL